MSELKIALSLDLKPLFTRTVSIIWNWAIEAIQKPMKIGVPRRIFKHLLQSTGNFFQQLRSIYSKTPRKEELCVLSVCKLHKNIKTFIPLRLIQKAISLRITMKRFKLNFRKIARVRFPAFALYFSEPWQCLCSFNFH